METDGKKPGNIQCLQARQRHMKDGDGNDIGTVNYLI